MAPVTAILSASAILHDFDAENSLLIARLPALGELFTECLFFRECFLDQIARETGRDPFKFRSELLSAALFGEITLEAARVVQGNCHDYPMLLPRDMPRIETQLVPSGYFWGGIGEPPLPPIAPAVCNALYAATGKPTHALPLSSRGLRIS